MGVTGNVRRHVDVYGGHGFLYETVDGRTILEHTVDGRWGGCDITDQIKPARLAAVDETGRAAIRHLQRKRHPRRLAQALAGTFHAGGGEGPPWRKGPRR